VGALRSAKPLVNAAGTPTTHPSQGGPSPPPPGHATAAQLSQNPKLVDFLTNTGEGDRYGRAVQRKNLTPRAAPPLAIWLHHFSTALSISAARARAASPTAPPPSLPRVLPLPLHEFAISNLALVPAIRPRRLPSFVCGGAWLDATGSTLRQSPCVA
jgi:hypothetical protein